MHQRFSVALLDDPGLPAQDTSDISDKSVNLAFVAAKKMNTMAMAHLQQSLVQLVQQDEVNDAFETMTKEWPAGKAF